MTWTQCEKNKAIATTSGMTWRHHHHHHHINSATRA